MWRLRFLSVVAAVVLIPLAASPPAAALNVSKATKTAECGRVAKGHTKVTRSAISDCKGSSLKSGGHCPKGSSVIILKIGKQNYALQAGHKPSRLANQYGMGALAKACGTPTPPPSIPTTTTTPATPTGIEIGPGPLSEYSVQPQPAPGSCHYSYVGSFPLPDPHCTPGATNPQVNQANIGTTICRSGYTSTIRPPEDVTEPEKGCVGRGVRLHRFVSHG